MLLLGACVAMPCIHAQETEPVAQEQIDTADAAPSLLDPSPLAVELVQALGLVENSRLMAERVLEEVDDPMEDEDERRKRELTFRYYREQLNWESFAHRAARMYEDKFTEEQMRDIVAFLRSPSGKAFVKETPGLSLQITKVAEQMMLSDLPYLQEYIEDNTPLGKNAESHNRAFSALEDAQRLTKMLEYYAEAMDKGEDETVTFDQLKELIPPDAKIRITNGKDRLGNPYIFTKVGEPVKVNPATRKALEPVMDASFWGRHGDAEGPGGETGMKLHADNP